MPSTVSARFALLVGALIAAHLMATNAFRVTDRDIRSLVEVKRNITPAGEVDALLVGGSGIHYGLNAELLSELTPWRFLNLGLIVEGNGWDNYLGFLEGLDMIHPVAIELVIYSSADIYRFSESDEFTLTGARRGALLFDSRSWLQRVAAPDTGFGPRSADRTVINPATGDMVFLDGVCDIYYPVHEMPPPGDELVAEIAARARDFARLFPNAEILVRPWPVSEHQGHPLERVHATLARELSVRGVRVLLPARPRYNPAWACDAPFHPDGEGRDALTRLEADRILSTVDPDAS